VRARAQYAPRADLGRVPTTEAHRPGHDDPGCSRAGSPASSPGEDPLQGFGIEPCALRHGHRRSDALALGVGHAAWIRPRLLFDVAGGPTWHDCGSLKKAFVQPVPARLPPLPEPSAFVMRRTESVPACAAFHGGPVGRRSTTVAFDPMTMALHPHAAYWREPHRETRAAGVETRAARVSRVATRVSIGPARANRRDMLAGWQDAGSIRQPGRVSRNATRAGIDPGRANRQDMLAGWQDAGFIRQPGRVSRDATRTGIDPGRADRQDVHAGWPDAGLIRRTMRMGSRVSSVERRRRGRGRRRSTGRQRRSGTGCSRTRPPRILQGARRTIPGVRVALPADDATPRRSSRSVRRRAPTLGASATSLRNAPARLD